MTVAPIDGKNTDVSHTRLLEVLRETTPTWERRGSAEAVTEAEPEAAEILSDEGTAYASTQPPTASAEDEYSDDWFATFDRRRDVAVAVCRFAGIPVATSRTFEWTVADALLRVVLWPAPDGRYLILVESGWPTRPRPRSLLLADAFAIATTRVARLEPGPSRSRWRVRMLVDLGFMKPGSVVLCPLPDTAPGDAHITWALIERHLGYRRVKDPPDEPFAFSTPTIACWYDVEETTVRNGKRWLEANGFLTRSGSVPSRRGRDTIVWLAAEKVRPRSKA